MRYLLLCLACVPFIASAQAYKCFDGKKPKYTYQNMPCEDTGLKTAFDGKKPKYTYQNMPCEDTGLKTAKLITNNDAMVGSADFSGYAREAKERAATSRMLERDHIERRNIDYERSGAGQRQDTSNQCAWLVNEKRSIIAQQRHRSTPYLQDAFNDVTKRMQKIDCLGS
ncbi:MAG: hypothetical protein NT086_13610 [Proteobacteria bacterium]|nr:hypothetical protein [Pseudomonadota bacterium]